MDIRKAVITAAGQSQRTLPLQTLVDRDGKTKTALAIIVEEALDAGIEEICIVVCPGDTESYRAAVGAHGRHIAFVEQATPLGYGHAVWCAKEFTGQSPFLLLVGDHLYLSREAKGCARHRSERFGACQRGSDDCISGGHLVFALNEFKIRVLGIEFSGLYQNFS